MSAIRQLTMWVVIIGGLRSSAVSIAQGQDEPATRTSPKPTIQPTKQLLWVDVDGGVESIHLRTFNADADTLSASFLPASSQGTVVGVGAGVRLVFVTLGARMRRAAFQDELSMHTVDSWRLWTIDGELGMRVPLGRWEPNFALAGGYARLGGIKDAIAGLSKGLDIDGADLRAAAGIDYYVFKHLTLGAQVNGQLLALSRSGVAVRDLAEPKNVGTINEAEARILEGDGSSVGWSVAVSALAGVHF